MTFPTIAHIRTWNSARRVAKLMQSIKQKYEGQLVTELMPNGNEVAATIVQMSWDDSVGLDGEWCVLVEYASGQRSWTGCDALMLGAKE